jgi:hypothetical protein
MTSQDPAVEALMRALGYTANLRGDFTHIRAAITAALAAERTKGVDAFPEGWALTSHQPASYLTDEANAEYRWSVHRTEAPFEGVGGARVWLGPTPSVALARGIAALTVGERA